MHRDEESLDDKVHRFNQTLYSEPLKAPQIFHEIVTTTLVTKRSSFYSLNCASHLANFIKQASIYKKREMAEAISHLPLRSKILIIREFTGFLQTSMFSVEAALSSKGMSSFYKKPALTKVVAYGLNDNGQLGIGHNGTQELMDVQLPGHLRVIKVYMGRHHTIFHMSNGSFYGSGKAENFMPNGGTGNIVTPVELDIEPGILENKAHCVLNRTGTIFLKAQPNLDLIIGKVADYGTIRERGPNWYLLDSRKVLFGVHVKLQSVVTEKEVEYCITPDGYWSNDRDIVFFVCGRRIGFEKFKGKISICQDGTIYAHRYGTLYKGKLISGVRGEQDETLVAFMEEVSLPFAVEGFSVDESGRSMIFYPRSTGPDVQLLPKLTSDPPHWLPSFVVPTFRFVINERVPAAADPERAAQLVAEGHPILEQIPLEQVEIVRRRPLVVAYLRRRMAHFLNTRLNKLAVAIYSPPPGIPVFSGLPQYGIYMMRALLALRHFIRIREKVPVVMLEHDEENGDDYQRSLEQELIWAVEVGRKIKVLTAKDPEEGESRKQEILQKAKIYLKEITDDINNSLECLVNLPPQYRREERDIGLLKLVHNLIICIQQGRTSPNRFPQNFEFVNLSNPKRPYTLRNVVDDRLRHNEIDREDRRFKLVRVEAVPVQYTVHPRDQSNNTTIKTYYIYKYSTEFFINLIDPTLLDFVEDGILNLNNACLENLPQFRRVFSAFFDSPTAIEHFQAHTKKEYFNMENICQNLPEDQKYVITTSDNKKVKVPAILLQLFSNGFDAARCRIAEANGTSPREMSFPVTDKTIRGLIDTLLDWPTFFHLDMRTKEEVFWLADYMIISHIKVTMIEMIVQTATEADSHFIKDLFKVYPEEMIHTVKNHRPDIILHWRELPFDTSNLDILRRLSNLFSKYHFVERDAPITISTDAHVDQEPIDKGWLIKKLINGEEDEDVRMCLEESMALWESSEARRGVKRGHVSDDDEPHTKNYVAPS